MTRSALCPLASTFIALMQESLTPEVLRRIDDINAERNDGSCASHDFLDANEVMMDAYFKQYGKPLDPMEDSTFSRVNSAWDCAKSHGFSTQLQER